MVRCRVIVSRAREAYDPQTRHLSYRERGVTVNRKENDVRSDFEAFVKREHELADKAKDIDWSEQRDEWLKHLDELYTSIETFLEGFIKKGEITIRYREIKLNEENIGSYNARQMILRIGGREIVLNPIGTLLIGAKGRVDVIGPAGRTRFMLVDQEASQPIIKVTVNMGGKIPPQHQPSKPRTIRWAWKIVTSPPAIRFLPLTAESLFRALIEVANG